MEVLRLNCIIAPVHPIRLVTNDFHRRRGIYPCPSHIRTGGMAEIVDTQISDSCSTTGRLKRRPNSL